MPSLAWDVSSVATYMESYTTFSLRKTPLIDSLIAANKAVLSSAIYEGLRSILRNVFWIFVLKNRLHYTMGARKIVEFHSAIYETSIVGCFIYKF